MGPSLTEETGNSLLQTARLWGVADTAPYLHDGSKKTIKDVVETMVQHQLGRALPADDIKKLVGFLRPLTGQWQKQPLCSEPEEPE